MRILTLIQVTIIALSLLLNVTACSSGGGGGDDPAQPNNTTWNDLVWDDGVNENSRKWAD